MIKAVVIVKDQEPKVVELDGSLEGYKAEIEKNLTKDELAKSAVYGLDFFSPGLDEISGMVEEYSACHPYERNRQWHGPAILTQVGDHGETVSMDKEHLDMVIGRYSLSNELKSPSEYINNFIEKYKPEPRIFNVEVSGGLGTLNTHDYLDMILEEEDEEEISEIECLLSNLEKDAKNHDIPVTDAFDSFLEWLGTRVLEAQVKQMGF